MRRSSGRFARFCDVFTTTLYNSAKRPELAEPFAKIKDAFEDELITGGMLRNLDGNLVALATGLADNQRIQATLHAPADGYDFGLLSDDEMLQTEGNRQMKRMRYTNDGLGPMLPGGVLNVGLNVMDALTGH